MVLFGFASFGFLEGFWVVLKWAAHVNDDDFVVFFDYYVGAKVQIGLSDRAVSNDFTKADGFHKAVDDFVMSLPDQDHVGRAVADGMWQRLVSSAVATSGRGAAPTAFHRVERQAVQAGTVNEAPVSETYIEAIELPG